MIALAILALACLADAYSTNAVLKRGGYEKGAAWLVGKHPKPATVWLVIGAMPIACGWLIVQAFPGVHTVLLLALAAWRGYNAYRNFRPNPTLYRDAAGEE